MSQDARISVGLPGHPKTKKLIKRLGQAAAWNLVCLILWAAANRSDGALHGMSAEDIELAADWAGEDGAFVAALQDVRFLDLDADGFVLHDWHEHNPWAAGADMRSAKARWNAAKRHHGHAEADRLVPEYAAVRNAGSNADVATVAMLPARQQHQDADATSMLVAGTQHASSNAPSPSPSPNSTPPGGGVARKRAAPTATPARPADVPEGVWQDFQAVRKAKRAALTDTALEGIRREAGKAGIGLAEAIAYCCQHGWQAFNAGWYADRQGGGAGGRAAPPNGETAYQRSMRERVAEVAPSIARAGPPCGGQAAGEFFRTVEGHARVVPDVLQSAADVGAQP